MSLDEFLKQSPLAKRICLSGRVVIGRYRMTPKDVAECKHQGQFKPENQEICELVIGNQLVASGKIINKGDKYYFQAEKQEGEK